MRDYKKNYNNSVCFDLIELISKARRLIKGEILLIKVSIDGYAIVVIDKKVSLVDKQVLLFDNDLELVDQSSFLMPEYFRIDYPDLVTYKD